jgi:hypothetical protein
MGANGKPSGPSTSFSSASMLRASSAGDVGSGDDIDSDDDIDDDNDDDEEEGGPAYAMPTSSTNIVVDVDSSWEFVAVEDDHDDDDDGDDDGILARTHPPPAPVVGERRRRAVVAWVAWKESQYGRGEVSRE